MNAVTSLLVNELFGPTFQGEGPSQGRRARLIRLSGCHLACAWCDTPQTWDTRRFDLSAERRQCDVADIVDWLTTVPGDLVVITGGEPLLQRKGLEHLLDHLRSTGLDDEVEVETSGTIAPGPVLTDAVTRFVVSPKLAHSAQPERKRLRPDVLRTFAASGKATWKFVAQVPSDLDEVAVLADRHGLAPVWIMPEGIDGDVVVQRLRLLADPVLARGWNPTSRLHILLWGNARGR
ncbi:7-carboxy-7-deazaguanine synthase QueE [Saccharothrix violaceirubra]|uniref:7-carboxy-7-deazaguanine synthase n=1 Tax=Saccharothrix violaceirubra TaxID=413306 RepID=A0A7W7WX80_9PSEU|nr:7-carboxy-7-deazaguanine synthase QueE [Saccharothrix violaceirubra]MBB4966841.1 organic radical activating enzyme [Saccharothrix violaceirubra]